MCKEFKVFPRLAQFITRCWCPFKKVVMESSSSLRGHKCRFSTLFVMRPLVSFCRTKPIEVLLLLEQQLDIERLDPQKLWFDWLMGWMWFPCSFLTLTAVLQYVDLIYGNLYPPNFQDCCYEETSSKYQSPRIFIFLLFKRGKKEEEKRVEIGTLK